MGHNDHMFKVLIIGDATVGKTSLVQRYANDSFNKHYKSTVGVDFALKVVQWSESETVRLQLWDIAGQERFTSMTRLYYREASACIIMFDVTNFSTFSNSQRWKQDLDSKLTLPDGSPVPCLLLANKCDLSSWAVTREEIDQFSKGNGFSGWTETSVKENKNINESMRNRKVVDYSQFQESDDADEDYGRDSGPPAKKIRSSPREAKNKRRPGKNSQEDSEDSEEKDVKTKKDDSHSPDEDFGSEDDDLGADDGKADSDYESSQKSKKAKKAKPEKNKRASKSRKRPAEDSEDEKEDHKNVRQQRQAASKAASKQREMLMDDVGSEEEEQEEEEAPFQEMTPSPVKGKGKAGRPTASKASKEKTPSPKEEDDEPESPPEKKKKSASPPPEKSGDEGSEDEAASGED
ncbi:nuclear ubiquitous casein and cyclin-dependent kinase substrate 1 isoform X2 [Chrysemys picta bellii]|uniref:nuclear ubiquitous casein and cyclin-dependent kinase substrate 1 isoform X2 n=1 Tax=Chrysemys picta bellii TaxID=8478 RepID=UPI001C678F3A|nr:nuclear ubiquitous casein and cyclin-dependent kinase substrate 1 isoform X3 [Chrysemys picta bellii]